ncbi:TRAP transporter substrate-binding protein [Ramlibacter tataouinensis]|uniref:Candidate periplasmic component n=1 Tax=Ramlibacter tataouinensis (strain ATCC BAA-407 / DSM 14655 / LMG 21543 / TTB310) TaxID=365046 RepID=F5Y0Y9_RAMTT|nr:DctP family TRAP transporter solute-binding subunit [Ramlibacter tataouinensis]AEG92207.1 Candidate periplasmic component [Ramlibacter tataouinensis TTB310]
MIRRRFPLLTVAAALLAGLGALPAHAQKVLKYAHFQPAKNDQPKHVAAVAFKEHVEKATGGSLKVEIYPAGQLGTAQQMMEGLRLGTVELAVVHDGGIPGVYKTFNIFGLPYLFNDHAHAYAVLDGAFGKELAEDMRKKTGIRLMAYADNGIRHFTNSKRPIKAPEDMKGLKMRVQPSPVFVKLVESLGGSPTAIDWGELPAALAQGTADGQENGVTNILAASLFQHQKHVTLDGHVYSLHAYLVSDRFYNGLTAAEKKAVDEGVEKAKKIHRDMTREQDLSAKKVLADKGMTVTELSAAEVDRFRKAAQPAVRQYLEAEVSKEWTGKLVQAADSTRSK